MLSSSRFSEETRWILGVRTTLYKNAFGLTSSRLLDYSLVKEHSILTSAFQGKFDIIFSQLPAATNLIAAWHPVAHLRFPTGERNLNRPFQLVNPVGEKLFFVFRDTSNWPAAHLAERLNVRGEATTLPEAKPVVKHAPFSTGKANNHL